MNNLIKHHELLAPRVPLADPTDGLLPVTALEHRVQADILIWDTMQDGHSVQLMLDGRLCGEIRSKTEDQKPGDLISMYLDAKHWSREGGHTLGFRASNPENGTHEDSPTISLLIDRTAPGATLLAPALFSQINFGDTLKGTLPSYAGMEPGDVIQTLCNGVAGPVVVVEPQHLTQRPVQIMFDRAFLDGLTSELITISYHVTDRAGNRSVESQAVDLTYQHQPTLN